MGKTCHPPNTAFDLHGEEFSFGSSPNYGTIDSYRTYRI